LRVSTITFSIFCLLIIASWGLLYISPQSYLQATAQNGVVEILTSIFLFLSAIRLIFFKWEKGKRWIPFIIGILLLIAAGEEMNWAKSFYNTDMETIVDRIGQISVAYILDTVLLFLVAIMTYLYAIKKNTILGYALPDFSLLLMFLITAFYRPYDIVLNFYLLLLIPLGVLFYIAYKNNKKPDLLKCVTALIMILGTYSINSNLLELAGIPSNQLTQFKELLFSFITLAYALYAVKEEKIPTPFDMAEN
jgi:hypothetical protein